MLPTWGGAGSLRTWINTLEMENGEQQKALDAARSRTDTLRCDNTNLKMTIRKLKPKCQQVYSMREELDELRSEMTESSKRRETFQYKLSDLEVTNSDLHEKLECQIGEMASLKLARQADKEQCLSLTKSTKSMKSEIELQRYFLEKKEQDMKLQDALQRELNSAVLERMEIINMLEERKSELEAALRRPPAEKPLSIYDEICMATGTMGQGEPLSATKSLKMMKMQMKPQKVVEKILPLAPASKRVPEVSLLYRKMATTVVNWISFALGFALMMFCVLLVIGAAVPMCRPAHYHVPCQDLLRDVLPRLLLPYCDTRFPRPPPF
ncbi:puff II/9-2 protein-like [Engraulis encrasicolus]|uniref:puff II/9-2 protein-like n=1 Tax=Engraulis encrasicolus TaxID=184585 RepID=UPI002FD091AC